MIESSWHSYSSLYTLGHRCLEKLFYGKVTIEEKIDGSQFNFGVFSGEIKCKSKSTNLNLNKPESMFLKAIEEVVKRKELLVDGWTYRAEYVSKPKHNSLCYDRVPSDYLIIFDIAVREEVYLSYEDKEKEARRLGLECVPLFYEGIVDNKDDIIKFLDNKSILGDVKIEGFVVKNYAILNPDKKILIGKFVSEHFKEIHQKNFKNNLPNKGDFIEKLAYKYKTEARWDKAIQHLRDEELLTNSLKDIGPLLKEISKDILKECGEEIRQELYGHFWPEMSRFIVKGFAEYYKKYLFDNQQIKGENLEEENKKEN